MWTIITLILGVATLISSFMAGVQKDKLDDIEKNKEKKFQKEILKSTKKAEFHAASEIFFRENEFNKYKNFFKYGYVVYHQTDEYEKPFKKAFGSKSYTDFSDFKIFPPDQDNTYYTLRLVSNFYNDKYSHIENNDIRSNIDMRVSAIKKAQKLKNIEVAAGFSFEVGYSTYFTILHNRKPYTFIIGIQKSNLD